MAIPSRHAALPVSRRPALANHLAAPLAPGATFPTHGMTTRTPLVVADPFILLTALFDLQLKGIVDHLWVSAFPLLREPHGFDLGSALAPPAAKARLAGAWDVWGLFVVSALFNTFAGKNCSFAGCYCPVWQESLGRRIG
jgi:hypothetical protein